MADSFTFKDKSGDTVRFGGGGLQSVKPTKEQEFLKKVSTPSYGSGGGSSGGSALPQSTVSPEELRRQQEKRDQEKREQEKREEERKARIEKRTIGGQIEVQRKTFETEAERKKRLFEETSTPLERQRYRALQEGYLYEKRKQEIKKGLQQGSLTEGFIVDLNKRTITEPGLITNNLFPIKENATIPIEKVKGSLEPSNAMANQNIVSNRTSIFGKIKSGYEKTNIWLSSKLPETSTLFPNQTELQSGLNISGKSETNPFGLRDWEKNLISGEVSFLRGGYQGVKDKPAKALLITGATAGTTYALGSFGGSALGTKIISSKPGNILGKTIGGSLIAGYGVTTGYNIYETPKGEKAEKLGEISSTEIIPGITGSYLGTRGIPKATNFFKNLNKKSIPAEEIISPGVLSGKKTFPELPKNKQLSSFTDGEYTLQKYGYKPGGYHSTGSQWWKQNLKVDPYSSTSELPGLYISSQVSKNFLRLPGKSSKYSLNVFSPLSKDPSIAYIQPKSFRINPAVKKPSQGYSYSFTKPTETGIADLPLIKTEIEAVIPESSFIRTARYKTKISGQTVKLDIFDIAKDTESVGVLYSQSGKKISSYSYSPGTSSSINPSVFVPSLITKSSKKSSVSYTIPETSLSYSPKKSKSKTLYPSIYRTGISSGLKPATPISSLGISKSKSPISPYYSPKSSYSLPTFSRRQFDPFARIRLRQKGRIKKFSYKLNLNQPTRYNPSLTGAFFNIKGKPTELGKLGYFGVRPILSSSKKKLRKSKKRVVY